MYLMHLMHLKISCISCIARLCRLRIIYHLIYINLIVLVPPVLISRLRTKQLFLLWTSLVKILLDSL
jgi:hypothetical protein